MWLLIDNYDSFTHILAHYLQMVMPDVRVVRNDAITVEAIKQLNPDRIILSPGPGRPADKGIMMDVIATFHASTPMLGVCLGHQALGWFFGAQLKPALKPMHGKTSRIIHRQEKVFRNIPKEIEVMRYHSLSIADINNRELETLAATDDGEIMAFQHKEFPVTGIQFHPESVLTQYGLQMIENWKDMY